VGVLTTRPTSQPPVNANETQSFGTPSPSSQPIKPFCGLQNPLKTSGGNKIFYCILLCADITCTSTLTIGKNAQQCDLYTLEALKTRHILSYFHNRLATPPELLFCCLLALLELFQGSELSQHTQKNINQFTI